MEMPNPDHEASATCLRGQQSEAEVPATEEPMQCYDIAHPTGGAWNQEQPLANIPVAWFEAQHAEYNEEADLSRQHRSSTDTASSATPLQDPHGAVVGPLQDNDADDWDDWSKSGFRSSTLTAEPAGTTIAQVTEEASRTEACAGGCGFIRTWHSSHCCLRCGWTAGREHGSRCEGINLIRRPAEAEHADKRAGYAPAVCSGQAAGSASSTSSQNKAPAATRPLIHPLRSPPASKTSNDIQFPPGYEMGPDGKAFKSPPPEVAKHSNRSVAVMNKPMPGRPRRTPSAGPQSSS